MNHPREQLADLRARALKVQSACASQIPETYAILMSAEDLRDTTLNRDLAEETARFCDVVEAIDTLVRYITRYPLETDHDG